MQYKNFGKLSLLTFTLVYLNGCGGSSTPKEDTNITEVNTTVLEKEEKVNLIPIVKEEVLVEMNKTVEIKVGEAEAITSEDNTIVEETPKEEEKQYDTPIYIAPTLTVSEAEAITSEDNTTVEETSKEDNTTAESNTTVEEENNETQEQEQEREDEEPVVIPNTSPVVDAKDDKSVEVNQNITITAEATDSDGEIISQRWSDEGNNTLSSALSFEYSNSEAGLYTLTFTATDDNGSSASDNMDVNVTEVVEECDPLAELLGGC